MRLLTLAVVLRNAGLVVVEEPGWQERGSGDFDPKGVICHHTAGPTRGDAPSLGVCIKGRPDLPGPLCQLLLARSGKFHVIAAGKANHAGTGSWRGVSGNRRFVGIEAENTGRGEPWPGVQLDAFIRGAAAVSRLIKSSADMVAGHKEYAPNRKIDPTGIEMSDFRSKVARLLTNAPQEDDVIGKDKLDDQKAAARQLIRLYLARNPKNASELDKVVLHIAQQGYEATVIRFADHGGAGVL